MEGLACECDQTFESSYTHPDVVKEVTEMKQIEK